MIKKIIIATIVIVLLGAVTVGAYDAYQGNSTLSMPDVFAAGSPQAGPTQMQGQQGSGRGQGQMGRGSTQRQGGAGQMAGGSQNGNNPMVQHDWKTLTGTVVELQQQGLLVDTVQQGELFLSLGQPGFAEQQSITFTPGDEVTIDGFVGDQGFFVAGVIKNDTTGQNLLLRDPNGRPLWAGPGRSQNGQGQGAGQGGRGQGRSGGQGQGRWGQGAGQNQDPTQGQSW